MSPLPASPVDDLPFTARLTAYNRYLETQRHGLITDPYAELLMGDIEEYASQHRHSSVFDYPIVRTYFIDHQLQAFVGSHPDAQVIILGAGLDTRAYRLDLPRCHVIEIDLPAVIDYKTPRLDQVEPRCQLTRVGIDLNHDWEAALLDAEFERDRPSYWILEGLLYYLEQERVVTILDQMHRLSQTFRGLVADLCIPIYAEMQFGPFARHFHWGLQLEDVAAFFSQSGWSVKAHFADDVDQGRDVGQRGMIFAHTELPENQ